MLASKLIGEKSKTMANLSEGEIANPLADDRFASMFVNRDFEIDVESEEYRLVNPVVSKHEKERRAAGEEMMNQFDPPSSDDEQAVPIKKKKKDAKIQSVDTDNFNRTITTKKSESLGDMLLNRNINDESIVRESGTVLGQREMTFIVNKPKRDTKREAEIKAHKKERKDVRRPVGQLLAVEKKKPQYWRGKRVK